MKYLCDACSRLVTAGSFSVEGDKVALVCPACGEASELGPEQERHAPVLELARPRPAPQGPRCPKCGAARSAGDEACGRCGLVYALFKPENLALPAVVEELWSQLESDWNNPARHEAFIDACSRAGALVEAARRYRIKAEQTPGDTLAARHRDELVNRLMAVSTIPMATDRPASSHPLLTAFVVAGFGAFLLLLIYYAIARMPAATAWP